MQINKLLIESLDLGTQTIEGQDTIKTLISHFNYSIKDINSYDELTDEEKSIITKEFFDKFVIQ